MKLTTEKLKDILKNSINKPLWGAREVLGIKFESGKELGEKRGENHFWISTSHWWLRLQVNARYKDIVNSETYREVTNQKITVLNGKKIIDVECLEEGSEIRFVFDNNLLLRLSPYAGKKREMFQYFTEDSAFSFLSDGTYEVEKQ